MIRVARKVASNEPPPIPVELALEYETNGSWPTLNDRKRFWDGCGVSSYLRFGPDPRVVLNGSQGIIEYEREKAEWKEARIRWLRSRTYMRDRN
jgi:hypothetical protein